MKKFLIGTAAGTAIAGFVAVGVLNSANLRAQAQPGISDSTKPAFDVTSVKPNNTATAASR